MPIDFTGLQPKPRPPTRKEAARYRRWVRYLSDSRLSTQEIHRRAASYTQSGQQPPQE